MFFEYIKIIISSVSVYFFIVIAIRFLGKKEISQLSLSDLVFILLISNSVQNAMVGSNSTLLGGLVAAGSLFIINHLLKVIEYHFPKFEHLVEGEPIILIYKGKINKKNLAKAKITYDELYEAIREHGVSSVKKVDMAIFEIDGSISIISNNFNKRTIKKKISPKIHNEK